MTCNSISASKAGKPRNGRSRLKDKNETMRMTRQQQQLLRSKHSSADFESIGFFLMGSLPPKNGGSETSKRAFVAWFGVTPKLCKEVWDRCVLPAKAKPKHLFWALHFLKNYPTYDVLKATFGADPHTLRKWIWQMIACIQQCYKEVIKWRNRLNSSKPRTCHVTVDGTDFRIREPTPFSSKWYSHKFKTSGLRYEVAISIQTGHIVWAVGPFPCGRWSDQKIFNAFLAKRLMEGECVEADGGYGGPHVLKPTSYVSKSNKRAKSNARARHETINRQFKRWAILGSTYRSDRERHKAVFKTIAFLTQLSIQSGGFSPYQVNY